MEQREQNSRRNRLGRLAATFSGEDPRESEADANEGDGCPGSREEDKTEQASDGGGDAAQPPVLPRDSQPLQHQHQDGDYQSPLSEEGGESAPDGCYGSDNAERLRVRELLGGGAVKISLLARMETELILKIAEQSTKIAVRKHEVEAMDRNRREKRTDGEVLMNMLAGTRAELRLLRRETMMPPREPEDESGPLLIMDYADEAFDGGAAGPDHGDASQPGQSDDDPASASGQPCQEYDLASGDSQDTNGHDSDLGEETEEEGEE